MAGTWRPARRLPGRGGVEHGRRRWYHCGRFVAARRGAPDRVVIGAGRSGVCQRATEPLVAARRTDPSSFTHGTAAERTVAVAQSLRRRQLVSGDLRED